MTNPATRRAGVYLIAEAGVNHGGSMDMARKLVDAAARAGADAVKFQSFKASNVVTLTAKKADYQIRNTGDQQSQLAMIQRLELDEAAHHALASYCAEREIQFLSSPFDLESVDLLVSRMKVPYLKIGSGEITNAPLLIHAARTGCSIILSTGMSTIDEIAAALEVLAFGFTEPAAPPRPDGLKQAYASGTGQALLRERITLLHCTTEYPAPLAEVNLAAMDTLRETFGLPVGFSDHTEGITVPVAAAARGAVVIEKHLTLDRNLPGPDHKASLEPGEFRDMVGAIRQVQQALGTPDKRPTASELGNRDIARRSLVAACPIRKGEPFTERNLTTKRPGTGISPMRYWEWLGRIADRDYQADDLIAGP